MKLIDLLPSHAEDFHRWISDKNSVKYSLSLFQKDRDLEWVIRFITEILGDKNSVNKVITANNKNVGYCGLSNISKNHRSAEYFILIGDREYWNQGIGEKAGREVMKYGFSTLGLNRIWLTVSEPNLGAIQCYKKLGFKDEGRLREACHRDGQYHDKLVMGILDREWQTLMSHKNMPK